MNDTAFSKNTKVSPDATLSEIRKLLRKFGAKDVVIGDNDDQIALAFYITDRHVRFRIAMPSREQTRMARVNRNSPYTEKPITEAQFQQQVAAKWRALFLVIKAKIECVESEIETFDEAFLSHIVVPSDDYPDGVTLGEILIPQLQANPTRQARLLSGPEWGDRR